MEESQGPPRFIVDINVGKLAKWLRILGYDALLPRDTDDARLVRLTLAEGRVLLTKDGEILKRRVVTSGRLKVVHLKSDDIREQLRQVVRALGLERSLRPFTLCLECNRSLEPRSKEEVQGLVPPFVYRTQSQYMQCPACQRLYWKGTHWARMQRELEAILEG